MRLHHSTLPSAKSAYDTQFVVPFRSRQDIPASTVISISSAGRRTPQPIAARPRRPVNRDLLNNVDSGAPDGLFRDNFTPDNSAVDPSGDGDFVRDATNPSSTVANGQPQGWPPSPQPSTSTWGPYDSDEPTSRAQRQQQQPLYEPLGAASSPGGYPSSNTAGPTYSTPPDRWQPPRSSSPQPPGVNPQGLDDWAEPTLDPSSSGSPRGRPTVPPSASSRGSWPDPSDAQARPYPPLDYPQQPQQPSGPQAAVAAGLPRVYPRQTRLGADWGEPDPLTDWGGETSGDATGWDDEDERDVGPAAGPARRGPGPGPEPEAATAGPSTGDWGPGGQAGSFRGPDLETANWPRAGSGDWPGQAQFQQQQRHEQQTQGAPGPSDGPGSSLYGSYDGWTGVRFTQDVRYDGPGGPYGDGSREPLGSGGGSGGPGFSGRGPPAGAAGAAAAPPGPIPPSDIVLLSGRDASGVLPLAPTSSQVDYFQPRSMPERIVQYVGSLGTSLILSKAAILAGPALLYPIWSPWIRAGLQNLDVFSKPYATVGLWRAEVLDVQINGLAIGGMLLSKEPPKVALLIGDPWPGGARASVELPYQIRSENIRPGDSVELLVLGRDNRFTDFKVVREVYLPQSGLWLCDYPFLNRDLFLSISIAVEQARRAAAAEQQPLQPDIDGTAPYSMYGASPGPAADAAAGLGGLQAGTGVPGSSEDTGWRF